MARNVDSYLSIKESTFIARGGWDAIQFNSFGYLDFLY
jgi:hypothetical protein